MVLNAKIVITDLATNEHTVTPTSLGSKNVLKVRLTHEAADDFSFDIEDMDGTIRTWLEPGCTIKIYIDTLAVPTTLVFYGMVESVRASQPAENKVSVQVRGRELFQIITLNRIVTETYLDTEVSVIVQNLMELYAPDVDRVTHVDVTTTTLDDIRFPYRPLKICLDELARLSGFTYYSDPDLKLHWVIKETEDSGLTYDENDLEATPERLNTIFPIANRVYFIGGEYMQVDQEQAVTVAVKLTKDKWYAQSFTPEQSGLDQISLFLKRILLPPDLVCEIRTDDPGNGPAEKVATVTYALNFIGVAASWRPIYVGATLLIGEKYWIVVKKTGDAANHYEWSHDNDVLGEYADSDDGITWVIHNGGDLQFAYRTHYEVPILGSAADYASKDKYLWREIVLEDAGIMDRGLARQMAQAELERLQALSEEITNTTVVNPVAIPERGKLVTVTLPRLNLAAAQFVVKEAELNFMSGNVGTNRLILRLG